MAEHDVVLARATVITIIYLAGVFITLYELIPAMLVSLKIAFGREGGYVEKRKHLFMFIILCYSVLFWPVALVIGLVLVGVKKLRNGGA